MWTSIFVILLYRVLFNVLNACDLWKCAVNRIGAKKNMRLNFLDRSWGVESVVKFWGAVIME
jgi:hypothetical protein